MRRLALALAGVLGIGLTAFSAPPASAYTEVRTSICTDSTLGGESEVSYAVDASGDATITGFRTRHLSQPTFRATLYVQSDESDPYAYVTFDAGTTVYAAGQWSDWTPLSFNSPRPSPHASILIRKAVGTFGFVLCDTDQTFGVGDGDSDGIPDDIEGDLGTDPALRDTDGGGASDGVEVSGGTNPLLASDDLEAFPNASNTGPNGVLTAYSGPCTITTADTVIADAVIAYDDVACPAVIIRAPGVRIENSEIRNRIEIESGDVTVVDSIIDGRGLGWSNGMIRFGEYTLLRTEVLGGKDSAHCNGNCTIESSWLHAQDEVPVGVDIHSQAVLSSGGANLTFRNNTLDCDTEFEPIGGGGCTAHLSLFAESPTGPLTNVLVDGNYFPAGQNAAWCVFAGGDKPGSPLNSNIVIQNNRWERGENRKGCAFGPITSIGPGTTLFNNAWIDGGIVN